MTPEQISIAIAAIGALTVVYGVFRTVRRIVHFFDALETAAAEMTQAVNAVNHHLTENGGRVARPLTEEQAKKATVMDLLFDIRVYLHSLAQGQKDHERAADKRAEQIIQGVREATQ